MIELTVKLFGPAARAAATSELSVQIDGDATIAADVLRALRDQHTSIASLVDAARLAVNHEFADADTPVRASDELALIGQVSGG
ncbi:MAG: hypothetical protein GC159_20205 [Phycisphaera sp.]|nr:hypothetical protein [Phycisphaera sp.]